MKAYAVLGINSITAATSCLGVCPAAALQRDCHSVLQHVNYSPDSCLVPAAHLLESTCNALARDVASAFALDVASSPIFYLLQHFLSQLSKVLPLFHASTSSPQLWQAPHQELAQLSRVNRRSLGLCTRAASTRCSNLHLHHGDLLPNKVVRHVIVTWSCAQLEQMRFHAHPI